MPANHDTDMTALSAIDAQGNEAARTDVQNAVRDAVRDAVRGARDGVEAAQAPAVAGAPASPATIDALKAMMAAERATIDKLTGQLNPGLSDAAETAITDQIEATQERLSSLQSQMDRALGVSPGVTEVIMPPPAMPTDIPPGVLEVTYAFFLTVAVVAIGVPLARAFARRMDRRGMAATSSVPSDLAPRLDRMEQAIEAIAIEVERVSEGQRFTNKLMSEARALPAPNPLEQWPQGAPKEAVPVDRRVER